MVPHASHFSIHGQPVVTPPLSPSKVLPYWPLLPTVLFCIGPCLEPMPDLQWDHVLFICGSPYPFQLPSLLRPSTVL